MSNQKKSAFANRFGGYIPIVVDVETGGLNAKNDALLEIAAVTLKLDITNKLVRDQTYSVHVLPFEGANIDPEALKVNHIDPYHPFRFAKEEAEALQDIFEPIETLLKQNNCQRGVLVGHNPIFDLSFIQQAAKRCKLKRIPFHAFTAFDTATLGGMVYGKTVLAKACAAAGVKFERDKAHSAIYDAEQTAELFCTVFNKINRV